ncbi:DedA family protein [Caproiciproducens sp. CPB-2]|uniref:DedA family protein n=1 Tax=Caproiciproducens sp. CPB-2 TaxID=3030017 RepID=UPI0023DAE91B|nr:DedA family protein [Caproiciproducens sp. CPB-2]MDF1495507.1 DedA family protein [Caproiciproducens sp. CPB-2]
MQDGIISIINSFGYLGIFLLIFIENIFPPIPSEVVLLFGGALTLSTSMNVPLVIVFATFGSLAGAVVLYGLGRILKAERLKTLFAGKFGQVMHLKPEYVNRSTRWFSRYQNKAVFICRCIPLMRSLISIPAGCNEMNIPLFLVLTMIGSTVWNTVLVLSGAFLGSAWESALPYLSQYSTVAVIVCIIAAFGYAAWKIFRKRKKS